VTVWAIYEWHDVFASFLVLSVFRPRLSSSSICDQRSRGTATNSQVSSVNHFVLLLSIATVDLRGGRRSSEMPKAFLCWSSRKPRFPSSFIIARLAKLETCSCRALATSFSVSRISVCSRINIAESYISYLNYITGKSTLRNVSQTPLYVL